MLNHFRTLLLNLSDKGVGSEHLPKDFVALTLDSPFREVYSILFPQGSSRYYKQFLANNYISIIKAAGMLDELKKFDNRISYSIDDVDYFKIYRHSNPAVSSLTHPIFVYGDYRGVETNSSFYDNFLISQIDDTDDVLVYSTVRKVYIKGNQQLPTSEDAQITLDFTNGSTSEAVVIGSTGISFVIGGADTFGSTSNKTWEFLVELPFKFDVSSVIARLNNFDTRKLFNFAPEVDVTNYINLWHQHYNDAYRLAGFLLAYVTKLDSTL